LASRPGGHASKTQPIRADAVIVNGAKGSSETVGYWLGRLAEGEQSSNLRVRNVP